MNDEVKDKNNDIQRDVINRKAITNSVKLRKYWIFSVVLTFLISFSLGYFYSNFRAPFPLKSTFKSKIFEEDQNKQKINDEIEVVNNNYSQLNPVARKILKRISIDLELMFDNELYVPLDDFDKEEKYNIVCENTFGNSGISQDYQWSTSLLDIYKDHFILSACKNNDTGEYLAILANKPSNENDPFLTPNLYWLDNKFTILSNIEIEEVFTLHETCSNIITWTKKNMVKVKCYSGVMGYMSNRYYVLNMDNLTKKMLQEDWAGVLDNWVYKLEVNKYSEL